MEENIWRIKHIPTGLFYCSRKGRFNNQITNLSEKGNFYTSEKIVDKVYKEDCKRAYFNEAQSVKYNLESNPSRWSYGECDIKDFAIVKYILTETDK